MRNRIIFIIEAILVIEFLVLLILKSNNLIVQEWKYVMIPMVILGLIRSILIGLVLLLNFSKLIKNLINEGLKKFK